MTKEKQNPGPDPERLKLEGDWLDRLKEAVSKPKPEPQPEDND